MRQRQAERMRRDQLVESGFFVVDHRQEVTVLAAGSTLHSRRTISALPGTGPVREPPRRGAGGRSGGEEANFRSPL